MPKPIPLIRG